MTLYGPVDPLAAAPRYTTVLTVKERLRIPAATATYDDRIERAIVAAEVGIDIELGRSFPDQTGGPIEGIPEAIKEAATAIAVAIYKGGDAPTGSAGADDWIGTLDVSELVRAEFRGNPLLKGFKVSWGIA